MTIIKFWISSFKGILLVPFILLVSTFGISNDTLIVGYTEGPPFVYSTDTGLEGISVWLWEKVASDLEIAFDYKEMSFADMLEALEDGSIDVNINALTVTSQREEKFDFSFPFFVSNSTIVTRERSFGQEINDFVSPILSVEFLSGFLFLIFIIFIFGFIVWLAETKQNEQFRNGFKGVWDGIWWSAVTMTTVGYGDKSPKTAWGKLFGLLWMFIALIFISSLTAGLTSNLTETRAGNRVEFFREFKEKNVGTVTNSGTAAFLKNHFFKNITYFEGLDEGLFALNKFQIEAFTYDEPIIRYRLKTNPDYQNLEIKAIRFDQQFYAFGFSKDQTNIKERVSRQIIKNTESIDWEILLNEFDLQITK